MPLLPRRTAQLLSLCAASPIQTERSLIGPWICFLKYIADMLRQAVRSTPSLWILSFVAQAIHEKMQKLETETDSTTPNNHTHTDFLTRYIQLQKDNPKIVEHLRTPFVLDKLFLATLQNSVICYLLIFN